MKNIYKRSWALGQGYLLPVIIIPLAAVLGAIYSFLDLLISSQKLSVMLFMFVVILAYVIPTAFFTKLKVRNMTVVVAAGFLSGLTAWYASWIVYTHHFLRTDDGISILSLATHPSLMLNIASQITETETGVGNSTTEVSNDELMIRWAFEALILICAPALGCWATEKSNVFCEKCGRWAAALGEFLRLKKPDSKALRQAVKEDGAAGFLGLSPSVESSGDGNYLRVNLYECPECKTFRTISLVDVTTVMKKKGPQTSSKFVARNLILEPYEFAALEKLKKSAVPGS